MIRVVMANAEVRGPTTSQPKRVRYTILAALLLLIVPLGILAQSPRTLFEFDPGLTVAVDLNKVVRLDFATGREKTDELSSAKWKVSGGASFRFKPLRKTLFDLIDTDREHKFVLGVGYEFSKTSDAGTTHKEDRIMADGTFRYTLPLTVLMTNRSRFEFRWIDGDFHWRYRNRLMFEKQLRIKKLRYTPFGAAEAVWDRRYTKWNIFKFTGGVQFRLIRRSTLDISYERQHCVTCSDRNTNIVGVTLNLYLRRKK
ncbi:MAG TPA: DUF2490 domain-containing protein [Pyrinomonadaceae bacterium]|nr:DUF2490 domain-containing protein [Pyrinomonadaceae bacterium]